MMRVFETKYGRFVAITWDQYVSDGLHQNSMGALTKEHLADGALLINKGVDLDTLSVEYIEGIVVEIMSEVSA